MPHVLIIHEVADYPVWKKVFDNAADLRRAAGEKSYRVLACESDPARIVHFASWSSHNDARRFFQSDGLIRLRAAAGVKSPEFIYLNEIETGTL